MAGAADKTNPSILVSHGPLLGSEGNNPLVFDKLGEFINSFNGLTGVLTQPPPFFLLRESLRPAVLVVVVISPSLVILLVKIIMSL